MTKKIYKCGYCNQVFGRKWNAQRHNRLIHSNAAGISNTNFRPKSPNKSIQRVYYYKRIFDLIGQVSIDTPEWLDTDLSDIFSWDREDIKIIDQLIGPYNELEELLNPIGKDKREFILSKSFEASLEVDNPVRYMNETVAIFRSIYGIKKIASNMNTYNKYYSVSSIPNLKKKIKNSYIFKLQNN
jgi:hypothetical protein